MNEFEQIKRDPFIQEETANQLFDFNNKFLLKKETLQLFNDPDTDPNRRAKISTSRTDSLLQNLILSYSMGVPITEILPLAEQTFAEFERHYSEYPENGYKLKLWENNGYQYAFWLLGLAYLLGLDNYIPKVASWISPEKEDGHDPLFAALFEQLGVPNVLPSAPVLLHPKGYGDLSEIVQHPNAAEEQKIKLMQSYLRNWYKKVIGKTVWKGWDEKGWIYFGFWSLEAGLVTVLYGLDDADYRDMTFYPKDLVNYARHIKKLPIKINADKFKGTQVWGGKPATHSGRWICPMMMDNNPNRVQHFNQGDILPEGSSTKGNYVWQFLGDDVD